MEGKVKINTNNFTQCNILCPIHFSYKSISIVYESDNLGKKFIVKTNNSDSYVSFKKVMYQLKDLRIIPQTHALTNNEDDVLGECLLIHEQTGNSNNKLLVYIPLEKSVSNSLSQNFFSKLDASDELRNGSMEFQLNDESLLDLIPNRRKFFWYVSNEKGNGTNTYIIFNDSIPIQSKTFNSLKNKKDYYKTSIEIIKLYGNDGSTLTIEGVEKTGVQVKCKKVTKTKDINLDKKCADDEDDYDSDDDTDKKNEFDTKDIITSFEGRILVFLAGFIGLFVIISLFKISERGFGMDSLKLILKLIGLLIWIPIQVSYIYVARFITNFIALIIFCLGNILYIITNNVPFKILFTEGPRPRDEFFSSTMNCMQSATFNGLNCNNTKILNFIIAILTLIYYFMTFSGFIRLQNKKSKKNVKVCLNKVRTLGPGFQIDRCELELDLDKFIIPPLSRFLFKKYLNEYIDNGGYSVKEGIKYAAFKIDKRFTKLRNYIVDTKLPDYTVDTKEPTIKVRYEYNFCDLFNHIIKNKGSDFQQFYKRKKCATVKFKESSDVPSKIEYDNTINSDHITSDIVINTTPVEQCDEIQGDYHFKVENTDDFENSLLITEVLNESKINNYYNKIGRQPDYNDINSSGTEIPLIRFKRYCMKESVTGYIFKNNNKEYIKFELQNNSSKFDMGTMTGYYKIEEIADYIENDYHGVPFYIVKNSSGGTSIYHSYEIIGKDRNNENINNLVEKLNLGGTYGNRLNNYYDKTTFNKIPSSSDIYMGPVVEIRLSHTKHPENKHIYGLLYCSNDRETLFFASFEELHFDNHNDLKEEPFFIVQVFYNNIYLLKNDGTLKILKGMGRIGDWFSRRATSIEMRRIEDLDLNQDFEDINSNHMSWLNKIDNSKYRGENDLINNKLNFISEERSIVNWGRNLKVEGYNNSNNATFIVSLRMSKRLDGATGSDKLKILDQIRQKFCPWRWKYGGFQGACY